MPNHFATFAIGLVAGVFGGLIGLGGGLIMIPLMVSFLKLDQCRAHGTSLAVLVFTGITGAITYGYHGDVEFTAALSLALPAMITASAGARFADQLPDWKLKKGFGAFLIFCSGLLLMQPYITRSFDIFSGASAIAVFIATGAFTGFLAGLMGVGGGTIMVPVMILLTGYTQHLAQGTALLVMVPTGLVGAIAHWRLGNVAVNLLIGMIPGIVIGTFIGASVAQFIPNDPLRWLFVVVAIYTGLRYIRTLVPETCQTQDPPP